MPSIISAFGYKIFFWFNEGNEPVHVHIVKGKPVKNSTKVWLTQKGGCIIADNRSNIPSDELSRLQAVIVTNYFLIIDAWKKMFPGEEIRFYC